MGALLKRLFPEEDEVWCESLLKTEQVLEKIERQTRCPSLAGVRDGEVTTASVRRGEREGT